MTKKKDTDNKKQSDSNRNEKGQFVEGNTPTNGLDKNPDNINKSGQNKGSRHAKTLLKKLMELPLNQDDFEGFRVMKEMFPKHFDLPEEKSFELFMELRQMQLVFSKNEYVAQNAIREIKDRNTGKSVTKVESKTDHNFIDSPDKYQNWLDQFFGPVEDDRSDEQLSNE